MVSARETVEATNIEVLSFTFSEENSTVVSPPNKVVALLALSKPIYAGSLVESRRI